MQTYIHTYTHTGRYAVRQGTIRVSTAHKHTYIHTYTHTGRHAIRQSTICSSFGAYCTCRKGGIRCATAVRFRDRLSEGLEGSSCEREKTYASGGALYVYICLYVCDKCQFKTKHVQVFILTYVCACIHTCILRQLHFDATVHIIGSSCMHTCIHTTNTHIHAYMRSAYMHTYNKHTYIHFDATIHIIGSSCVHTYIQQTHTHTCIYAYL
jgi:hypothetical protein